MPESEQFRRNLGWPDPGESGQILAQNGQTPAYWPESGRSCRNPDSGDIDRMLSDFGTGKISMMVDCLK
jgi:hypothetical protein